MHACDHQSRGNLNRTRFFSVGQVKYNLCRHRRHALLNEMESYDLREFKCKLPRELWTHVTNFLLGSAKEELVNIFLKLKCPSILPVALGELMLKYKHIWYFESETGSGSHTKYHHFLTKFVLPYTKMYLESHPKKFSKDRITDSNNNSSTCIGGLLSQHECFLCLFSSFFVIYSAALSMASSTIFVFPTPRMFLILYDNLNN